MAKRYWLVKSEPDDYSFADLVRDGQAAWTGVRNYAARNSLRAMQKGDRVLVYHTGDEKRVVGLARVVRVAYPDPTAKEGDFSAVDLAADKPLLRAVPLAELRADAAVADLLLLKQSRLSVMPVAEAHFQHIAKLGKTRV